MFSTPSSYEHGNNNRVAAARSLAAAAALATVGNGASPSVVYRLIEQADRKNKVMSADPKRTLFRTLLQRRHFQILREEAAQVERAHQAELLREQQRLQEQIFNLRFQQTGHAVVVGHHQTIVKTTPAAAAAAPAGGPIGIARPAHFNAALLRNKDSQGWPSNQWTAVAAAATPAPAPVPVPVSAPMMEEYHEFSSEENVTFESEESSVSSVSAFEQEWMEVTSSSASLPVGTAPMCTVTISTATPTTTTTTTPSTPSTPLSTGSSSFFGLPCGTAGLSVGTHQSEVNQEVVVSASASASASASSSSSPSPSQSKYSRVVAAPIRRSEGRGWGNGSGKRGACSSSFVGSAKKIREDGGDDDDYEREDVEQVEKREVRIGFASSPFQWQSLFDQSQLQQVLCN